jgi:hypothetical protein
MRKEMITTERAEPNGASTGELIGRLTRETTLLVKAEIARVKLQASTLIVPVATAGIFALVGLGTFLLGLLAFGVALFAGIHALTGSAVISGLVVGGVAWLIAGFAAAICAAVARAIPMRLKRLEGE